MASDKLTDSTLESILWNKVPVELQKEVKEITGSMQELLQKLFRAESVIAKRDVVSLVQQVEKHKEQDLGLVKGNRRL